MYEKMDGVLCVYIHMCVWWKERKMGEESGVPWVEVGNERKKRKRAGRARIFDVEKIKHRKGIDCLLLISAGM